MRRAAVVARGRTTTKTERTGFTLIEIMLVVAIIGLLAAIAVPSFMKARAHARRNACINNLRQLDAGKDEYALEYGVSVGDSVSWSNVGLYVKDITNRMLCPTAKSDLRIFSNSYTINAVGSVPVCQISPGNTANPDHSVLYKTK